jgi:hypothetical protein
MSVHAHLSELPSPSDRRRDDRLRLTHMVPTRIGRGEGELVDLSPGGARIRHSVGLRRGTRTRVRLTWRDEKITVTAVVLASRVVGLTRPADGATVFETRVEFQDLSRHERGVLDHLLGALQNHLLWTCVANMNGWHDDLPSSGPMQSHSSSYLQCRRIGNSWSRKWTADGTLPRNGFVVPATTPTEEIELLCQTFEQLDDDGRHLLRLMCEAAIVSN